MENRKYTPEEIKELEKKIKEQPFIEQNSSESLTPILSRMDKDLLETIDRDDEELEAINKLRNKMISNGSNLKKRIMDEDEKINKRSRSNAEPIKFTVDADSNTPSPKAQRVKPQSSEKHSPKGNNSFSGSRTSMFSPNADALAFSIQTLLQSDNNEERKSPTPNSKQNLDG